ncbi:uncharacterized protein LOC134291375 [Aedes albopictus]|uniref:Helix-turn-helix domain-containing protein n=1 Tax=Aedes albopictus TaxID=7160 RepID=A0ABM1YEI4_AEDAL
MLSRKNFLIECRRNGFVPQHIVHSLKCVHELLATRSPYARKLTNSIMRFQKTLLNVEIEDAFYRIKVLHRELAHLKSQIINETDSVIHQQFFTSQEFAFHGNLHNRTDQTNKKLRRIVSRAMDDNQDRLPEGNEKAILNTTTKAIPPEANILLSMGPKFVLPYKTPSHIPFFHLIADVENVLSLGEDQDVRERTRCQVVNHIQNFIQRFPSNSPSQLERFCHKAEVQTRKFVKDNPDILITEADKGNRTVVMSLEEYDGKMMQLVNDPDTYEQLRSDPTDKYQRKNNSMVQRLVNLQLIDGKTKYQLMCYNAVCPRIYGLPKAHKQGMPLRPVVPNVTAPTYHLSKYIAHILQSSFTSEYDARDSKTFCEYVNRLDVPPDHIMVSLDAVSLFTNVTKPSVIHDVIMIWDKIREKTKINLDLFLELVSFCMDASFFCFRGKFFHQRSGTAMGSPLSPVLADIVMDSIISRAINAANIPPQFIRKYVDDLFLLIHKDRVQEVLEIFNLQDENIKFTCEVEVDGKLPYLDMLMIQTGEGRIKTDWYSKPISSGRILNFFSFHPIHQKLGVATNFINRVRTLSTIRTEEEKNQLIRCQLTSNDYPLHLINRMLHQPRPPEVAETPNMYRSVVHIPGLTPTIRRILRQNVPSVGIACSNNNTVKQLYKTAKDPVPYMQKSNVVYKIACRDCSGCYIGMTKNQLRTRMYGHQTLVNTLDRKLSAGLPYSDPEIQLLAQKTAMMEHCVQQQHRFDVGNPTIVDCCFKTQALPVLEMCHILTTPQAVNRRTDTADMSATYSFLIASVNDLRRESGRTDRSNNQYTDATHTTQHRLETADQ